MLLNDETASLLLKQVPSIKNSAEKSIETFTYCKQFDSATIDDKAVCGNLPTDEKDLLVINVRMLFVFVYI